MSSNSNRVRWFLLSYALTAVVWFSLFQVNVGEFETLDLLISGVGLCFGGGAALLVFNLRLLVLEVGWVVFTYSYLLRVLDEVAEGPEVLEALLPGLVRLVGLGIILLGFARSTTRLRADLADRNERLTVLNRVLRHNLRNGLTPIISSLQHFRDGATDERDERIATIGLEKAHDLSDLGDKARLVDDVLEAAGESESITFDLAAVTESILERFRADHPEVEFEVSVPGSVEVVATEGLDAAIENLVENAIEHNDAESPVVEVAVESVPGMGVVTVADNGPGIAEEELEPIRSGEESALEHSSGIGLWFVTWLVEKSDGTISFEYDGGQRVTVGLPAADATRGRFGFDLS